MDRIGIGRRIWAHSSGSGQWEGAFREPTWHPRCTGELAVERVFVSTGATHPLFSIPFSHSLSNITREIRNNYLSFLFRLRLSAAATLFRHLAVKTTRDSHAPFVSGCITADRGDRDGGTCFGGVCHAEASRQSSNTTPHSARGVYITGLGSNCSSFLNSGLSIVCGEVLFSHPHRGQSTQSSRPY
jgi:hypothetical protein